MLYEIGHLSGKQEPDRNPKEIIVHSTETTLITEDEMNELEFNDVKILALTRLAEHMRYMLLSVTEYLDFLEQTDG